MSMDLGSAHGGITPPAIESHSDPPSLLADVIVSTVALQFATLLFIAARAYVNVFTRKVQFEDIFSYAAWLSAIAQAILIWINSESMARHLRDISDPHTKWEGAWRYNLIFICYTISGEFAKATV